VINSCVHFENCSGCDFLDYQYRDSLILKENYLKEILQTSVKPIVASPKSIFYRHKLQLPFGKKKGKFENLLTLGLHSRDMSRIIDLKEFKMNQ
jgi:23S rRNA (uracil1939-C5)-methyltransferase